MITNSKFILTCPRCGHKNVYVGSGQYCAPYCCKCFSELTPAASSLVEKMKAIHESPVLQKLFGDSVSRAICDDSASKQEVGECISEGFVYDMADDVYDAYNRMFTAITGNTLDMAIDHMESASLEELENEK